MAGGLSYDMQTVETSPNGRYIRYSSVLGKGAYKTVYKAFDTEEALEVAWNKLHVDRLSEHDLEKVSNEVSLLRQVNHKNIIHFYDTWRGIDSNGNQSINFITEQMMSGTLKEYLRKAKAIKLKVIRRWCWNILEAISYLHSQDPPIMHRDLKCDNIFINGHVGEVKIGDLGLSGVKEREKADSVIGTPEFMAPELYEESYTEKVDIYAFGMCLLEIVSMEYPYSECNNMAQIFKKVFGGEKPKAFDMLIDGDVKHVISACLEREAKRPSAHDLLDHPLFKDWEKDSGVASNLFLVKGSSETVTVNNTTARLSASKKFPNVKEIIDWSDPLKRNVLVTLKEGEGGLADDQQVSVVAAKENGGFYIGLEIPIRDAVKRVEFTFDPFEDSSQHIAQEMVAEFDLGGEKLAMIQREIDLQVNMAKEQRKAASRNATPQPAGRQAEVAKSTPSIPTNTNIGPPVPLAASSLSVAKQQLAQHEHSPPPPQLEKHIADQPSLQPVQSIQPVQQAHQQSHAQDMRTTPDQTPQPAVHSIIQPVAGNLTEPTPVAPAPLVHQIEPTVQATLPVMQEVHSAHQVLEQRIESVSQPSTQAPTAIPLETIPQPQVIIPQLPSQPLEQPSQQVPLQAPVPITNIITEPQQIEEHLVPSLQPVTEVPLLQPHEQQALDTSGPYQHVAQHVQEHTTTKTVMFSDVNDQVQAPQAPPTTMEVIQPNDQIVHPSQSLQHSGVAHMEHVSQEDLSHMTQVVGPEHYVTSHQGQEPVSHHVDQSIPHTSSFASSKGLSSASMGSPNGVLSPTMPSGPQHVPVQNPQQVPVLAPSDNSTQPSIQEVQQHQASEAVLYHPAPDNSPMSAVNSYVLETDSRGIPVNGNRSIILESHSDRLPYAASTEDIRQYIPRPTRPKSAPFFHVVPTVIATEDLDAHDDSAVSPESHSEGQLPTSTSDIGIDVAPRPLSTPASSGLDLSDDHLAAPSEMPNLFPNPDAEAMSRVQPTITYIESKPRPRSTRSPQSRPPLTSSHPQVNPRPKSWSRPAIVVVSSKPSAASLDSSKQPSESSPVIGSDYSTPNNVSHVYASNSSSNRVLSPPEQRIRGSFSSSTLGEFTTQEQSKSQQTGSPRTEAQKSSNWVSSTSDEKLTTTSVRTISGVTYEDEADEKYQSINLTLMSFCAEGRYEEALGMLGAGASATFTGYDRRTPLHLAAFNGHPNICLLLIQSGAELNVKDRWGSTPLTEAKKCYHKGVIDLLLKSGAVDDNSSSVDVLGLELMLYAAKGDLEKVKERIVAGAHATFKDYDQRTPLHLACTEGHAIVVDFLLVNGAVHSEKDRMGRSPVEDAVKNGHRAVLRVLRQFGGDIPKNILDADAELMAQRGMDLVDHAAKGRADAVRQFLSRGADPNFGDYDNRTALHLACCEGQLEIVKLLLIRGADISAVDRWGATPLEEAQKGGFKDIVEELKRFDLKRSQRVGTSVSFDHSALMNGHDVSILPSSETETAHFEQLSHGIATSVSMGAIPNIHVYADDFMEYPTPSAQDASSAAYSFSMSLPQTPFDKQETGPALRTSADALLLQQAYEAHRMEAEKLHRKQSTESVRSSQSSVDSSKPRPAIPTFPVPASAIKAGALEASPGLQSGGMADSGVLGNFGPGSVSLDNIPRDRYGSPISRSRIFKSSSHSASPVQVSQPGQYQLNDDNQDGVNSDLSRNSTIRLLVDGMIDAAVRRENS